VLALFGFVALDFMADFGLDRERKTHPSRKALGVGRATRTQEAARKNGVGGRGADLKFGHYITAFLGPIFSSPPKEKQNNK
jgi:hypothetical protein